MLEEGFRPIIRLKLGKVCLKRRDGTFECRSIPHNFNAKRHWGKRYRWNKAWTEEVGWQLMAAVSGGKKILALDPAHVRIVLHHIKLMDHDNAYACVKPLVDSLKVKGGLGLIRDDDPEHLQLHVEQKRVATKAEEHVEIAIGAAGAVA